ncbi:MAG: flavodoxin family protein [Chloroflexota bacterium]|nr:flavodoxin family protein [Chloroflexota bacterium]
MSAKVIIVYESKYGNAKRVAETIAEDMSQIEGIETVVSGVKEVDLSKIPDYDAILVGSPTHIAGPTGGIKKFIGKLGKLPLEGKFFAAFSTYMLNKSLEQATEKLDKRIKDKVPGAILAAPGLSIKVQGMKGPISEGELLKCKEFGNKIATQMKA